MKWLNVKCCVIVALLLAMGNISQAQEVPYKNAVQACAKELANKLIDVLKPREAKVIDLRDGEVRLAIGSSEGIVEGMIFSVKSDEQKVVGTIRISEARKDVCIARILEDKGIAVGNKAFAMLLVGIVDFLRTDEKGCQLGIDLANELQVALQQKKEWFQGIIRGNAGGPNAFVVSGTMSDAEGDIMVSAIVTYARKIKIASVEAKIVKTGEVMEKFRPFPKVAISIQLPQTRIDLDPVKELLRNMAIPIIEGSPEWLGWMLENTEHTVFVSKYGQFIVASYEPLKNLNAIDWMRAELREATSIVGKVQRISKDTVESALWYQRVYTDPPYIYKSVWWHSAIHGELERGLLPGERPRLVCPGEFNAAVKVPKQRVVEARITAWMSYQGSTSFDNVVLQWGWEENGEVKSAEITNLFIYGEHTLAHKGGGLFIGRHAQCWFWLEAITEPDQTPFTLLLRGRTMQAQVSLPIGELLQRIK